MTTFNSTIYVCVLISTADCNILEAEHDFSSLLNFILPATYLRQKGVFNKLLLSVPLS